jgi:3-amino-4-hydroxybenzoic acid synthase
LTPNGSGKEVWLDARALEGRLTESDMAGFHGVLFSGSTSPDAAIHNGRLGVTVDGPQRRPLHERAQLLVYREPELRSRFADLQAAAALEFTVRNQDDLSRMAKLLRERQFDYGIVQFDDLTNIPLEFLIAWFQNSPVKILKRTGTIAEGEIAATTLERGSAGILLSPTSPDELARAKGFLAAEAHGHLTLVEWEVRRMTPVGVGHRACVDAVSLMTTDEGMLVGSTCAAMILACSETHPLPYMPLRPFRVNAGGVHSYILGASNQTHYLGDLRAGGAALVVDSKGATRTVAVGRVKLERRPLCMIEFASADGEGNIFVQNDWHVRLMGANGEPINVTSCVPGTKLLGYRSTEARHCGIPITEQLLER